MYGVRNCYYATVLLLLLSQTFSYLIKNCRPESIKRGERDYLRGIYGTMHIRDWEQVENRLISMFPY